MIIAPNVASSSVPMMISTPFFAIGREQHALNGSVRPMPARIVQQRLVGQKHLALGRDTDAHAADFALVRDVARLDFCHQRKACSGDRGIQRALVRHQHFIRQRQAGRTQQRFAVVFGQALRISDAPRYRAPRAGASTGGANLNFARSTIRRIATPAWVNPDSTTAPEAASSPRANCEGSV